MSLNKKADASISDNTVGLIIAAAGIIVMIFLLVALYNPAYNPAEETSKSYLRLLNEQIISADAGLNGILTFWAPDPKDIKFYLVYFGDFSLFKENGMTFVTRKKSHNTICICYGNKDKMTCKSCKDLDLPVELKRKGNVDLDTWILNPVKKLNIMKTDSKYLFSVGY